MDLKQKFTSHFTLVSGKEMSEEDEDKFAMRLEELLNEYQVFRIEATLNPFSKEIYIK